MKKLFFSFILLFICSLILVNPAFADCGKKDETECDDAVRVEKIADNKYEVIAVDAKLFSGKPIRYDGRGKTFFVKVGEKEQQLKISPKKAVEVAYISGMMNEFGQDGEYKKVKLVEKDGKLFYEVRGKKTGKILGIWGVSYDTKAQIDGEGRLISFEKPFILKFLKYIIK